jgi:hypothetical protein
VRPRSYRAAPCSGKPKPSIAGCVNYARTDATAGSPSSAETTLVSKGTQQWQTETFYDSKGRAYQSKSATVAPQNQRTFGR